MDKFNIEKFSEVFKNSFNPDNFSKIKFDFNKSFGSFNPDKMSLEKFNLLSAHDLKQLAEHIDSSDFESSYEERWNHTPKEGERGHWTGDRGESIFVPSNPEIKEMLKKYGLEGIPYKDGVPDFSKVAIATVEISNMTENREGKGYNFEQADQALAEKWNKEGKDGRTDWTGRDVEKWREQNKYTWHERNDMKTMDLVPTKIHQYFGHFGGCGECRIRDGNDEEDFDE